MSNEEKYTLGPWIGKVDGKYQSSDWEANNDTVMTYEYAPVVDERGRTVCLVVDESSDFAEDNTRLDYNAHLIAAAPELYEALKAMLRLHELSDSPYGDVTTLAYIALAKANGEEE